MECSKIKLYHVDAFTDAPFRGNPAAVCISQVPLTQQLMQKVAQEMNLSETAFVIPCSGQEDYEIRWFTPMCEMDLCGHATLAAAKVLYDFYDVAQDCLTFNSRSGVIKVFRYQDDIMLNFPKDEVEEIISCSKELLEALGLKSYVRAVIGKRTRKLVIHIEDEEQIPLLKPDFLKLTAVTFDTVVKGVGVTAKGIGKYDMIVRYFNPWAGVNEDPVTGSVHTLLADYWSRLLNKKQLLSYQASERGGEIKIILAEDNRVELWGKAVIVAAGELFV